MVEVEILSAQPYESINILCQQGIELFQAELLDALTVKVRILRRDWSTVKKILSKRGDRIKIKKKHGIYWRGKRLLHRPILLTGIAMLLLLISYLPSRIFFFRIEGNQQIPQRYLLEVAAQCGLSFGASRREVRSERVKNALLEAIPQLQWAGVNTYGCVATISVRERQQAVEPERSSTGVSSIIAAKAGVITSCTATKGNLICKVGQAVKAGELLISGYTDCGLSIRATQAQGEVYAITRHDFSAIAMTQYEKKEKISHSVVKYSLIIGKNRINFYKDSGNLDVTCDKMYEETYITLPGGFRLPVSIVKETWTYYDCSTQFQETEEAEEQLSFFCAQYLTDHMIAGEILEKSERTEQVGEALRYTGAFTCREMIGRVQEEEIILPNGKHD